MSEQKPETETVEEKAPELPTSEPPKDEAKTEEAPAAPAVEGEAAVPAVEGEAAAPAEENKEEKKPSRLRKRLTLKWGKNRDQAEPVKEPEQPADPRENALAWVNQQIPAAAHKVNHLVLQWVQQLAVPEESERQAIPGKDGQVTRNQFLAFLRDGDILTKLANKLQPGAVEVATAEEGADVVKQKEVQTQNIEAFSSWAKTNLGIEESKVLTASDLLEKGKAGYPAVFETLWNLGLKAQEKFSQAGLDVDAVVAAAGAVVRTNIIGMILSFFRRSRRPSVEKKDEEKTEEQAAGDVAPNAPEGEQVDEVCQKVDATANSTPAVAAN
ncbi:unnamed protein product [Auanema sp. JU1783]|nr:unnamed protein product [Auanema sp. JU1783]